MKKPTFKSKCFNVDLPQRDNSPIIKKANHYWTGVNINKTSSSEITQNSDSSDTIESIMGPFRAPKVIYTEELTNNETERCSVMPAMQFPELGEEGQQC